MPIHSIFLEFVGEATDHDLQNELVANTAFLYVQPNLQCGRSSKIRAPILGVNP